MTAVITHLSAVLVLSSLISAHAAIVPDRTRVIYPEDQQSVSVTITNKNKELPFVAQSWIEDEKGVKVPGPFMVLPPLQRVEANDRNVLRIVKLPGDSLPKDRESVFYLNIREIPPKTETVNAMQIALQSKLKLFYRPKGVERERGQDMGLSLNVQLDPAHKKIIIDNPTPFHVTVVGFLAGTEKTKVSAKAVMISPISKVEMPVKDADFSHFSKFYVSNMNDYGGQTDSEFNCVANVCHGVQP
ncbi:fimbria/pilus periplasmic chaperone [Glaciimonas sp. GS1]|uniref:Fimbria/pilus periplasmic chaperone n=2 Tax=Glaciimonas soli TaxID=2590999 RepID=A0A843YWX7_9BURK|nr:fimbria/pilus periplasmic chaperone [Glaciimonas soli]